MSSYLHILISMIRRQSSRHSPSSSLCPATSQPSGNNRPAGDSFLVAIIIDIVAIFIAIIIHIVAIIDNIMDILSKQPGIKWEKAN